MAKSYKFLRVGKMVFKIFAWVSAVFLVVAGVIVLIVGGAPVPTPIPGVEIPARVLGLISLFQAVVYFFLFWLVASLIQLWLDIREHLGG